jgi:hypothetical protein
MPISEEEVHVDNLEVQMTEENDKDVDEQIGEILRNSHEFSMF